MLTSFKRNWTSCEGAKDGAVETASNNIPKENDSPSFRNVIGSSMGTASDFINANLIAARYGAMATILLLTAYGVSNTPLFFRFRTVNEIPASYFKLRRALYCRIINVNKVDNQVPLQGDSDATNAVQVTVRHLSPIGQILPKPWFDFFMRMNPLAVTFAKERSNVRPEEIKTELLRVELAGVQMPPTSQHNYRPEVWMEQMARQRALVRCQLLARKVPVASSLASSNSQKSRRYMNEEDLSGSQMGYEDGSMITEEQQIAVCRMTYRPTILQLFATDISELLVRTGKANVSSSILPGNSEAHDQSSDTNTVQQTSGLSPETRIVDASQRIQDLRHDVKYLDRLAKTELQAAKESKGMWSNIEVRDVKRDIVDEAEFQTKANAFQKLWRWLRG